MSQPLNLTLPAGISPVLPAVGLAIIAVLYYAYQWLLPKPIAGIPYNEYATKRLTGDVPEMMAHVKETNTIWPWIVSEFKKMDSPMIQLFTRPFAKPWVLLADFKESQDILMHRTKEFDRSEFFGEIFSGALPMHHLSRKSDDPRFKANRMLLKDLMTPAFLNGVAAPNVHTALEELARAWSVKSELAAGRPWQAGKDLYNAILDSMFAVTFKFDADKGTTHSQTKLWSTMKSSDIAKSADTDTPVTFPTAKLPEDFESIVEMTDTFDPVMKSPFPQLQYKLLFLQSKIRHAYSAKENLIDQQINEGVKRMLAGEAPSCALDDIIAREATIAQKEGRLPDFKRRQICDELFGFIIAGHDTTATTSMWGLKRLQENQETQRRLRKELQKGYADAFAEGRNPTAAEITSTHIPYLDAWIEENVRLALTAAGVVRTTMQDVTVLGTVIPKGTDVFMMSNTFDIVEPAPHAIPDSKRHHSALNTEKGRQVGSWDPSTMRTFDPTRWLTTDEETGEEVFDSMAGPQLAFGLGPRGCFGRRLAYLTMKLILVMTVWNFELGDLPEELCGQGRIDSITSFPKDCYVRLQKVEKNDNNQVEA